MPFLISVQVSFLCLHFLKKFRSNFNQKSLILEQVVSKSTLVLFPVDKLSGSVETVAGLTKLN